jgi:hypothetical protein
MRAPAPSAPQLAPRRSCAPLSRAPPAARRVTEALRFSRPSQIGRRDLRSGRATATATRTAAGKLAEAAAAAAVAECAGAWALAPCMHQARRLRLRRAAAAALPQA